MTASSAGASKSKTKDRCYKVVKRAFRVWPSAYASGALVKCRRGLSFKAVKGKQKEKK